MTNCHYIGYSMRLIHRVIAFPPHATLSRMFYQPVLRTCWFIPWQAALKSYYSYISILSECWPGYHSDSQTIFYRDWSGTSPNRTRPPKLVGSNHRHQPGLASLVLPPTLDRSDYSEPWPRHDELSSTHPPPDKPAGSNSRKSPMTNKLNISTSMALLAEIRRRNN